MAKYQRRGRPAIAKTEPVNVEMDLPMQELIAGARRDIEAFCGALGLQLMKRIIEREIEAKVGPWGKQRAYRHGTQAGYVVYAGRKVALRRPRLRSRDHQEVPLESYQAFQSDGKLQQAVARQIIRRCSMRDYAGALEACVHGYGIQRSSVSRQFKVTTAQELKAMLERPVPADLLAVLIDAKYFPKQCIIVALGLDKEGRKHVLGLWAGATENTSVVKGLLEDLVARGLPTERKLLFVLDGGKALRKAVQDVFGTHAVVQRCRVHKQRNVADHVPKDKQGQVIWRLRAAWAKSDPKDAEAELRKVARWLEGISPMAARSLKEGLEETLTLQKLGINRRLAQSLSSTNMIESCFAGAGSLIERVKRWREGDMVLRWAAATLTKTEKGFRRIRNFEHLGSLQEALTESETLLKAA